MKYVAISAMDALVNYSLEELRRGHYTIKSGGGRSNEVTEAGLAQLIEVRLPKTDSFEIRVRKFSSLPCTATCTCTTTTHTLDYSPLARPWGCIGKCGFTAHREWGCVGVGLELERALLRVDHWRGVVQACR